MSYLSGLRLHFSGQFQTNVSTVNNDAAHFNNAAFKAEYQQMQGPNMSPPNGWFNPQGDGTFRLLGCRITAAHLPSGEVTATDPVLSYIVADSDTAVPAKLVDLDPEQQLTSQIFGLSVRIADAAGNTLMRGDFEPSAFTDIWDRGLTPGGGDTNAGAYWQSVLTNLEWGDIDDSPFLSALQAAAAATMLSIKFNMDGINLSFGSPDFMCGRLVGTIGPQSASEPRHIVLGRHFMSSAGTNGNFFRPAGLLNFCCARVDDQAESLLLDLGNALPTTIAGGPIANIGDLTVGYLTPEGADAPAVHALGIVPATIYTQPDWYATTAGVVSLPLTADQRAQVAERPLAIVNTQNHVSTQESPSGAYLRADDFVYRLSPGDRVDAAVCAMRFGRPLADTEVGFAIDNGQLQPTPDQPPFAGASPPVGEPLSAVPIPATATTDANGVARLQFTCGDPGNVRWFNDGKDYGIDGQVYGVRPSFVDRSLAAGPVNQWDFISFLIWSAWSAPHTPPTWADVEPIFRQYANLYPVMSRFLDLGGYASVVGNAWLLRLAFGLPVDDPNHMPVTRDLSPAKRAAIMAFLADPREGDAVPAAPAPAAAQVHGESRAPDAAAASKYAQGGKTAAAARRLVMQQH